MEKRQREPGHLRRQVVHGEPLHIAGRTLTPVVRVVSYARGRGTVRRRDISGWALGLVRAVPLGVKDETGDQQQWVAVHDATAAALRQMALAAAALTLLLTAVRWLVRRCRQPSS